MTYENILYNVDERVCTLSLNRPEKMNALSWALRPLADRTPRQMQDVSSGLADYILIDGCAPPDSALKLARKDIDLACQGGRQYDVTIKFVNLALAEMTQVVSRSWSDRDSGVAMTFQ